MTESYVDRLLRVAGAICLAGFLVCSGAVLLSLFLSEFAWAEKLVTWAGAGAMLFLFLPVILMSLHLAKSRKLSEAEKERWDRIGAWGGLGFLAAFFYLMRKDRRLPPNAPRM